MKQMLAKFLIVIVEAGIEALAERIKERRSKNGNRDRLDHLRDGGDAYDLPDPSAARPYSLRNWQALRRERRRSMSWD